MQIDTFFESNLNGEETRVEIKNKIREIALDWDGVNERDLNQG